MKIENLKLKIVFFGSPYFVTPILQILHEDFDVVAVVTTSPSPVLDFTKRFTTIKNIILASQGQALRKLSKLKPDVFVVAAYGHILSKEVLDIPKYGSLNVHPSLLPKYRGPTPIQTAILNGDTTSGVSIIKLDEELDHGPILATKKEPILPHDTAESLYQKYNIIGAQMLTEVLPDYVSGTLKPILQDHTKATYTNRLKREDGYIDSNNPPSKEIVDRMIRAYYPWPGTWTKLKIQNEKLKVLKLLPNKYVQIEGKKPVDLETFYRGYPELRESIERLLKQ